MGIYNGEPKVMGWFCSPKTEKEEIVLLSEVVPKNTKYNYTKWAVNALTAWENTRVNKKSAAGNRWKQRT